MPRYRAARIDHFTTKLRSLFDRLVISSTSLNKNTASFILDQFGFNCIYQVSGRQCYAPEGRRLAVELQGTGRVVAGDKLQAAHTHFIVTANQWKTGYTETCFRRFLQCLQVGRYQSWPC